MYGVMENLFLLDELASILSAEDVLSVLPTLGKTLWRKSGRCGNNKAPISWAFGLKNKTYLDCVSGKIIKFLNFPTIRENSE